MDKTRPTTAPFREGGERIAAFFVVSALLVAAAASALVSSWRGDRLMKLVPRQAAMYVHAEGAGLPRLAPLLPSSVVGTETKEASIFALRRDDGGFDFGHLLLVDRRLAEGLPCAATTVVGRREAVCLVAADTMVARLQHGEAVGWSLADDRAAARAIASVRSASATQAFFRSEWWEGLFVGAPVPQAPGGTRVEEGLIPTMAGTWDAAGTWRLAPVAASGRYRLSANLPSGRPAPFGLWPEWAETLAVRAEKQAFSAAARLVFLPGDDERSVAAVIQAADRLKATLSRVDYLAIGQADGNHRPYLAHFRRVAPDMFKEQVVAFYSASQPVRQEISLPDGSQFTEIVTGGDWLAFVPDQSGDETLVSAKKELFVPPTAIRQDGEGGFWISDNQANFASIKDLPGRYGRVVCGNYGETSDAHSLFGKWLSGRVCIQEDVDKSVVIYKE